MVKPRQGSRARSIHPAADREEKDFFVGYVKEPVMVQRLMGGRGSRSTCSAISMDAA
jgi:carbamoyl-phosphate synthase large subunit